MGKAIGYIRQSKERKDRDSISPETQLEKIKQFAILQDNDLVATFQDIDISGFRVHYSKRTGLLDLLEFIKANEIEKVYVYALSRLSRRIKEFIEVTDILEGYGVSVVSATEMVDMATPQGRLFRNILLSFNEYYSDSLSSTILDNHKKNVQLGKWNGGNVSYGFNWDKQNMKFDKNDDFKNLELIIQKAVEGWGVKKISNYLNKIKIKSPQGKNWNSQTVKYILSNRFYLGNLNYDGESYNSDTIEQVITNEQWEIIQKNLSRYDGMGPKVKVSPHLLTGILQCECGSRYEIRYNGSTRVRRYICASRQYNQDCNSNLIDADSIEVKVIERIQKLIESSYFEDIVQEHSILSTPTENTLKNEIKRLESELSKIVQAQEDIYQETFINRNIKKERFYEINTKFDTQREALEIEIKNLYTQISKHDINYIVDYKQNLKEFIDTFSYLTKDEQRIALHDLIDTIIVYDDYIFIDLGISQIELKSSSIKRGTLFFGGDSQI